MKIIHCADLHLGSKIALGLDNISSERRAEVRASLSNLVKYAIANEIKIILLSGDVFDSDTPLKKDKDYFYSIVRENKDIDFIYLKGNHDINTINDDNLSNLKTFNNSWMSYRFGRVVISGIELNKNNITSFYSTLNLNYNDFNIVMLHGDINKEIDLFKLKNKGIDYLALGHIHSFYKNSLDDRGIYAYSGCLIGRGFDEDGEKGFIVIDINDNNFNFKFVPNTIKMIENIDVDISNLDSISLINNKIRDVLNNKNKNNIYRIILKGDIHYNLEINEMDIKANLADYYFICIKDVTKRKIDENKYLNEVSLRGEFIRTVLNDSTINEDDKKEIVALGLRMLEGREVEL